MKNTLLNFFNTRSNYAFVLLLNKGRLNVVLNSKRDNNAFVKSFAGDIATILAMAVEKHWIQGETNRVQFLTVNGAEIAKMECSGKCKVKLGVEQHINLKEERIGNTQNFNQKY